MSILTPNLHKKFGSDISKIVDFFYRLTFGGHFSVFQWNQKQRNDCQKIHPQFLRHLFVICEKISDWEFQIQLSFPKVVLKSSKYSLVR